MIISVVNEKGGAGKTTIALFLACKFAEEGKDVLLIDADPQNSTDAFLRAREDSTNNSLFSAVSKRGKTLRTDILNLAPKFDIVIVDVGGRDNFELRTSVLVSDITIIPTRPSQFDVDSLVHMLQFIPECQMLNEKLQTLIVGNLISTNHALKEELNDLKTFVTDYCKDMELEKIYMLNSDLKDRVAFKNAPRLGQSLSEHCKTTDKALIEFNAFFKELQGYMGE